MRTKAAIAVVALLAVGGPPAALAKVSVTVDGKIVAALKAQQWRPVPLAATRKDRLKSCQVGASKSRIRIPGPAGETLRKASTVACEQPPWTSVNVASLLNAAGGAAFGAGG
jgi:hypothetical protein